LFNISGERNDALGDQFIGDPSFAMAPSRSPSSSVVLKNPRYCRDILLAQTPMNVSRRVEDKFRMSVKPVAMGSKVP
jgi:hypothetical protein